MMVMNRNYGRKKEEMGNAERLLKISLSIICEKRN